MFCSTIKSYKLQSITDLTRGYINWNFWNWNFKTTFENTAEVIVHYVSAKDYKQYEMKFCAQSCCHKGTLNLLLKNIHQRTHTDGNTFYYPHF